LVDLSADWQARFLKFFLTFIEMFYVYAISSLSRNYIYVGKTSYLDYTIKRHNAKREKTTRPYAPFELIYSEKFETRMAARQKEKYLKSGIGKENLRQIRDKG
jgi:putative endonuclease